MHFHIVTLFPEAFASYLEASILARAIKGKKVKVSFYNPRDFSDGALHRKRTGTWKYQQLDDKPYGGGPGMVLLALPFIKAAKKAIGRKRGVKVVFFSTDGEQLTNARARAYAKKAKDIVFICGHYEGVDERVAQVLKAEKISIGPYVLTGGELPALVMMDAIARQVPGVLGKYESLEEEREASPEVYTRPEVFSVAGKKYRVPKVLLTGNHQAIEEWRRSRRV
jgi:tRNA (guanine37-N1)-methyltransferase